MSAPPTNPVPPVTAYRMPYLTTAIAVDHAGRGVGDSEPANQDGFAFRAVKVWTGAVEPGVPQHEEGSVDS
jgi:hypothetical protein